MYATKYSTGAEVIHDGQVDTRFHQVLWEEVAWEYTPRQRYQTTEGTNTGEPGPYLLAASKSGGSGPYQLVQRVKPRIQDWLGCVIGGCVGAAQTCILATIGYPECVVLACASVKVVCTLQWIISNWP